MAKFLNKKQQVLDFKLTPYGKYLLSNGSFKPIYYAFFDSEILYDKDYARHGSPNDADRETITKLSGTTEPQNEIHKRIKEETQYLEGFPLFREVEDSTPYSFGFGEITDGALSEFNTIAGRVPTSIEAFLTLGDPELIQSAIKQVPRADFFRFESAIGDAHFDAENQQHAPAWKIVTLQGQISSSATEDISYFYETSEGRNEEKIPQINVILNYTKRVQNAQDRTNPSYIEQMVDQTNEFADGKVIALVKDDLVVYADEINTQILTENFDLEVFHVETEESSSLGAHLTSTATISSESSTPDVGDKVTIKDGVTSATFEFINAAGGTVTETGNIGVVVSNNYIPGHMFGETVYRNRIGTMENLFAAINQTDNPGWDTDGAKSRCRTDLGAPSKCYSGTHTLNVTATKADPFKDEDTDAITIYLTNLVPGSWGNQAIETSDADGDLTVSGFSGGKNSVKTLHRKYFEKEIPQVVNGMMVSANKTQVTATPPSESAVEYYFDVHRDLKVDYKLACRGAEIFNKDSYYVDLDFECTPEDTCKTEDIEYYDIYGNAIGDPDVCE